MFNRYTTKAIIIHTTASNSQTSPDAVWYYHVYSLGWGWPGYNTIYAQDGTKKEYADWRTKWTYGILPNRTLGLENRNVINLSYVGGINNYNANEAVCNISQAQEIAMIKDILLILKWYPDVKILGHNQVNRYRACPSFWVPDWLEKWGIPSENINAADIWNKKASIKQLKHPEDFYTPLPKDQIDLLIK